MSEKVTMSEVPPDFTKSLENACSIHIQKSVFTQDFFTNDSNYSRVCGVARINKVEFGNIFLKALTGNSLDELYLLAVNNYSPVNIHKENLGGFEVLSFLFAQVGIEVSAEYLKDLALRNHIEFTRDYFNQQLLGKIT